MAGKEEDATEGTPSEQADLVDVFYAQFVRPLGNLVILFAQAEAAWLQLVAGLTGCTEKEAQRFLQMKGPNAKQEIVPLAQTSGIEGFDLQELSESIEKYYCDRERRHRLMHDEWYVSLLQAVGVPRTRRLPRKKGAAVVWGDSTPDDIWKLALRFREYEKSARVGTRAMARHAPSVNRSAVPRRPGSVSRFGLFSMISIMLLPAFLWGRKPAGRIFHSNRF